MKIDFNVVFKEYSGKAVTGENGEELTMADLVGRVLFGMKNIEMKDMLMACEIVQKLQQNPSEVELSAAQISFIEEQTSKVFNVGLYGQLYNVLEGKDK